MLIKIATHQHSDSFVLFDRADAVRYEAAARTFTAIPDLYNWLETMEQIESARLVLSEPLSSAFTPRLSNDGHLANMEQLLGPLSEKRVYRLNTLTFEREGRMRSVTFDTIAYICNDDGKTLEKAHAGGTLNFDGPPA